MSLTELKAEEKAPKIIRVEQIDPKDRGSMMARGAMARPSKVPPTMTMKATTATLAAFLQLWCLVSPCASFGITSSLKFCQNRVSNDLIQSPLSLAAPQRMHTCRRRRRSRDIIRLYDASASATTFEALEEDLDEMIGAWIPIASASALRGLGPQRVEVMGLELVVWQAHANGPWSVMSDACPHRLAPLSQGRVDPSNKLH